MSRYFSVPSLPKLPKLTFIWQTGWQKDRMLLWSVTDLFKKGIFLIAGLSLIKTANSNNAVIAVTDVPPTACNIDFQGVSATVIKKVANDLISGDFGIASVDRVDPSMSLIDQSGGIGIYCALNSSKLVVDTITNLVQGLGASEENPDQVLYFGAGTGAFVGGLLINYGAMRAVLKYLGSDRQQRASYYCEGITTGVIALAYFLLGQFRYGDHLTLTADVGLGIGASLVATIGPAFKFFSECGPAPEAIEGDQEHEGELGVFLEN